jgi:hypothetical protein
MSSPSSFFGRLTTSARSSLISSKEYKATIQLLDDSETINTEYKKSDNGQVLLDYVCDYMNIIEKDYFGLRFQDANKHRYWLDTTKSIAHQIRVPAGAAFRFRIRYYPADPTVLKEEITRYQLFLQLRRDLLHGRLYCPQNDAALLGAYIIQSELGDYDENVHKTGYVSEYKLILKQTEKLEDKIAQLHRGLSGLTPAEAELEFLKKAAQLETYGFDPHTVKDAAKNSTYIGVTHQGVLVYQANRKVHHIKWQHLDRADYIGKEFRIYPTADYFNEQSVDALANDHTMFNKEAANGGGATAAADDGINHANNIESPGRKRNKHFKVEPLQYTCPSATFAKHLWRQTLSQRAFFTEAKAQNIKPQFSKPRIPIISRGSTFRYSGRVLHEIAESDGPCRETLVPFVRYHVEKQLGRDERPFAYTNKYNTMPGVVHGKRNDDMAPANMANGTGAVTSSQEAPAVMNRSELAGNRSDLAGNRSGLAGNRSDLAGNRSELTGHETSAADSTSGSVEREKVTTFTIHMFRSEPSPNVTDESTLLNNSNAYQSEFEEYSKLAPIANSTPTSNHRSAIVDVDAKNAKSANCVTKMNANVANSADDEPRSTSWLQYLFKFFFIVVLLSIVLVTLFEVRDNGFRRYVHGIPGLEHARHAYYEPSRAYVLKQYDTYIARRFY